MLQEPPDVNFYAVLYVLCNIYIYIYPFMCTMIYGVICSGRRQSDNELMCYPQSGNDVNKQETQELVTAVSYQFHLAQITS